VRVLSIELRKDPLNPKVISIIASHRTWRPKEYKETLVEFEGKCPFCPGNEHMTPPATLVALKKGETVAYSRDSDRGPIKEWIVRIIPNKYPIVSKKSESCYGYHEVIIESRSHDIKFDEISLKDLLIVFETTFKRAREILRDKRVNYLLWFRNEGSLAGASLKHPHSQIISFPFTPPLVLEEIEYFHILSEKLGDCPYCNFVEKEVKSPRLVYQNEHFVILSFYAPRVPFELKLIPKIHQSSPWFMNGQELKNFCDALKRCLSSLRATLPKLNYNMWIHSAPNDPKCDFHWHLELLPVTAIWAGVEGGSGIYVVTLSPEDSARMLRNMINSRSSY